MTRITRRALLGVAGTILLLVAFVVVFVALRSRSPSKAPPDLVPASWARFRTSPGHEAHVGHGKIECRDCHDFEREGFKNPGPAVCTKCHDRGLSFAHHGALGGAATKCLTCHLFAPGQVAQTCIGCHDKPQGNFLAIALHAKVDCAKCHGAKGGAPDPAVVAATCAGCHDERAIEHGGHADSKGCLDCHHAHEPAKQANATCSSCHAEAAKPHPVAHNACISCHEPHTFVASEGKCLECHREKTTLAERSVPAHRECLNCHAPHAAPSEAAAACARCHEDVRVRHGSAGACVTCHAPHGDDAVALSCTSCHTKVASTDRGAHAGGIACNGCHKTHDFADIDAKGLCQTCHARETSLVATNPGHGSCTACHGASAAHAPAKPEVACATCHPKEQSTARPGHERCVGCHEPHAGKPTPACATCHAKESRDPHGTIAGGCETCHRPHGPGGVPAAPACKTCHSLASLPALHAAPGHAAVACASCHASPHALPIIERVTCLACHANKRDHNADSATCNGCHVFKR